MRIATNYLLIKDIRSKRYAKSWIFWLLSFLLHNWFFDIFSVELIQFSKWFCVILYRNFTFTKTEHKKFKFSPEGESRILDLRKHLHLWPLPWPCDDPFAPMIVFMTFCKFVAILIRWHRTQENNPIENSAKFIQKIHILVTIYCSMNIIIERFHWK